jgi:hypothetical protein
MPLVSALRLLDEDVPLPEPPVPQAASRAVLAMSAAAVSFLAKPVGCDMCFSSVIVSRC